jgi:branched-subunit amino acid transport protein
MQPYLYFIAVGIATTLPRSFFLLLGERIRLPQQLMEALRYAPAAALSALTMPDIFLEQDVIDIANPKVWASAVVLLTTLRCRNAWLPFISGMLALYIASNWPGLPF